MVVMSLAFFEESSLKKQVSMKYRPEWYVVSLRRLKWRWQKISLDSLSLDSLDRSGLE